MEKGWYWVEHLGFAEPAHWDGEDWNLKGEKYKDKKVFGPIPFSCPTGCVCTTNPDGSVNVNCNPR